MDFDEEIFGFNYHKRSRNDGVERTNGFVRHITELDDSELTNIALYMLANYIKNKDIKKIKSLLNNITIEEKYISHYILFILFVFVENDVDCYYLIEEYCNISIENFNGSKSVPLISRLINNLGPNLCSWTDSDLPGVKELNEKYLAVSRKTIVTIIEMLINCPYLDINCADHDFNTPLHYILDSIIAQKDLIDLFHLMLQRCDIDIYRINLSGDTALYKKIKRYTNVLNSNVTQASYTNWYDSVGCQIVGALISKGLDLRDGRNSILVSNLLNIAANSLSVNLTRLLLVNGANVDDIELKFLFFCNSPPEITTMRENMIKLLLEFGVNLHKRYLDAFGQWYLMNWYCIHGGEDVELFERVVAGSPDAAFVIKTKFKLTPIMCMRKYHKNKEFLEVLRKYRSKIINSEDV